MKLQFTSTNVQPHPTTTQNWIGPLCVVNKQLEKGNNRADLLTAFVFVFSLQIILILSYLIYVLFLIMMQYFMVSIKLIHDRKQIVR